MLPPSLLKRLATPCLACLPSSRPTYGASVSLKGIVRAKANGVYAGKGRPSSIDAAQVRELKAQGPRGATKIAKALGIGRASV